MEARILEGLRGANPSSAKVELGAALFVDFYFSF
jgi:hypothetical protein